jgi:hypothetical protein
MSIRKHPATAPLARRTIVFAGARWLALAHRLANRYRLTSRRLDSAIRWRRILHPRRFTQHNYTLLPAPQWRVNIGLNVHLSPAVHPATHAHGVPLLQTTAFSPTYAPAHAHSWRTSITNHLVMQRFVTRQAPAARQPMQLLLSEHVVHTAVRPMVRERSRVQPLPLPRPAAALARSHEPVPVEPRAALVRDMSVVSPVQQPRVPDINIAQITEQVMRQLDHRISAWRERRGRA